MTKSLHHPFAPVRRLVRVVRKPGVLSMAPEVLETSIPFGPRILNPIRPYSQVCGTTVRPRNVSTYRVRLSTGERGAKRPDTDRFVTLLVSGVAL